MAEGVEENDEFILNITLNDVLTGVGFDLTGFTTLLRWKMPDGTLNTPALVIASATGGFCTYTVTSSNLTVGTHTFEVDVIGAGGDVLTTISSTTFSIRSLLTS